MNCNHIGEYGCLLARIELIKRGIVCITMNPVFYDFDLYTNNNKRIEIKTANLQTSKVIKRQGEYIQESWTFNLAKWSYKKKKDKPRLKRDCDYYVLVCLNLLSNAERFYVVPNAEINHNKRILTIHRNKKELFNSKSKWVQYKNNWEQINSPPQS